MRSDMTLARVPTSSSTSYSTSSYSSNTRSWTSAGAWHGSELGQVMHAIIRRGPFATPFTANWQLGTLGGACPVTQASATRLLMPGQSSMRKPNFNCQDVVHSASLSPSLSVRVCGTDMSNCSVYVGLHVIKCKLQTNTASPPSLHLAGNKQFWSAERDLCAIFDMHFQFSSSFKGLPSHPIMNSICFVCTGVKFSSRSRDRLAAPLLSCDKTLCTAMGSIDISSAAPGHVDAPCPAKTGASRERT